MDIFTQSWAEAYHRALSENQEYKKAAARWEGAMALMLRADPAAGIPEDRAVLLDLWHGECRGAKAVKLDEAMKEAQYVIEGDSHIWQEILEGRAEPLMSVMRGRLHLKKGSISALAPYVKAAQELVKTAQKVASP
ncbi:MAG TPA: Fis family transcriptional regulator [Meiothermus sp.]|jgi:putative sterol carrier protein|nr:Fis family transcriptional regulator [Meiothermus sp.]